MNEIIKSNKLKSKISELKKLCQSKELYLRKYFNGMRNEVDQQFTSKLLSEPIADKKQVLIKLWNQVSDKIYEQEKNYHTHELSEKIIKQLFDKLDSIEAQIIKYADFDLIEKLIEITEDEIHKNFFQNKTVMFIDMKDYLSQAYRDFIDGKLLILNDEFISARNFQKRSPRFFNVLSIEIIKSIELERKLNCKDCIIDESFSFHKLIQLSMSSKHIIEIKEDTFKGFDSLQHLDLSWNKISEIQKIVSQELNNLRLLNLTKNQIQELDGIAFEKVYKMENLILSENKISTLNGLRYFTNLKKLYLGCNLINKLDCFVNMNKLEELYLYKNEITQVKTNSFDELRNLKVLDLESNKISIIEENAFTNLSCLQVLNLSKNQISQMNEKLLNGLISLERLDLKSNQILLLDSSDYKALANLKEVNLFDNKISSKTQANLIKEMSRMRKIGITVILPVRMKKKKKKIRK